MSTADEELAWVEILERGEAAWMHMDCGACGAEAEYPCHPECDAAGCDCPMHDDASDEGREGGWVKSDSWSYCPACGAIREHVGGHYYRCPRDAAPSDVEAGERVVLPPLADGFQWVVTDDAIYSEETEPLRYPDHGPERTMFCRLRRSTPEESEHPRRLAEDAYVAGYRRGCDDGQDASVMSDAGARHHAQEWMDERRDHPASDSEGDDE